MSSYVAEFSNGASRMIANSVRQYSHAWHVQWARIGVSGATHFFGDAGFARTKELAEKAAASCARRCVKPLTWAYSDELPKGTIATVVFSEVVAVRR